RVAGRQRPRVHVSHRHVKVGQVSLRENAAGQRRNQEGDEEEEGGSGRCGRQAIGFASQRRDLTTELTEITEIIKGGIGIAARLRSQPRMCSAMTIRCTSDVPW